MTKLRYFFCLSLLITCSNVSYGDQPIYAFIVDFKNACSRPVRIVAHSYTTEEPLDSSVLEQNLNVADKIRILHILAYSESIDIGVPSSYKFEINSNGNKFNLDSAQFRGILKKTKKEQKSSRHSFFWTIDDSSFCP